MSYGMEWVPIPVPPKGDDDTVWQNEYLAGTRVMTAGHHLGDPGPGETGVVVGWGRGANADAHWREHHPNDGPGDCRFGRQCDALCDEEGPVIHFDGQDEGDERLAWYPGQAMVGLKVIS